MFRLPFYPGSSFLPDIFSPVLYHAGLKMVGIEKEALSGSRLSPSVQSENVVKLVRTSQFEEEDPNQIIINKLTNTFFFFQIQD